MHICTSKTSYIISSADTPEPIHGLHGQITKGGEFSKYTNSYLLISELSSFLIGILSLENSSVQFSSVTQSCPTLCDPMNHSTPGFPVHHQLLEFTQTHVYQVRDAIQLSLPLLSHSPLAPNTSQHQSLFQ